MTPDDTGGSAPALQADRLGRRYGHVWALRDCTLEVPAGAIAGLVGPNGAGKTTLLEMIIGLLEPTEGQVSVFGVTSRVGASLYVTVGGGAVAILDAVTFAAAIAALASIRVRESAP